MALFFKLSYLEVRAFLYFTWQRQPFLVDAYSTCNVSYSVHYMFAYAKSIVSISISTIIISKIIFLSYSIIIIGTIFIRNGIKNILAL